MSGASRVAAGLLGLGQGLRSRLRNRYYRLLGVRLGGYVWMRAISIPRNWADICIEAGAALDDGVVLLSSGPPHGRAKIQIGAGTYINRYTMLDAHARIELGRDCMVGPHCYITDGNHGIAPGAPVKQQPMEVRPVIIEDEVWIGAGAIVLAGVRLGRGAVIGAGSVVTADVAAGGVALGVPARLRRLRG